MLHDAIVHKLFMGNGEKVGIVTILSKKGDDDSDNELAGLTNRIKRTVQTEVAGVKSEIKAVNAKIDAVKADNAKILALLEAKK